MLNICNFAITHRLVSNTLNINVSIVLNLFVLFAAKRATIRLSACNSKTCFFPMKVSRLTAQRESGIPSFRVIWQVTPDFADTFGFVSVKKLKLKIPVTTSKRKEFCFFRFL